MVAPFLLRHRVYTSLYGLMRCNIPRDETTIISGKGNIHFLPLGLFRLLCTEVAKEQSYVNCEVRFLLRDAIAKRRICYGNSVSPSVISLSRNLIFFSCAEHCEISTGSTASNGALND